MKPILPLILLLLMAVHGHAQDLAFLRGQRAIIEFDYSECSINGYEESNILQYEEDWTRDKPRFQSKFLESFNSILDGQLLVGHYSSAPYTIVIAPSYISEKGNMTLSARIYDNASEQEIYRTEEIQAYGGRIGSFLNLVGDGMKDAGKQMAREIHKLMTRKTHRRTSSRSSSQDDIYRR